MSLILSFFVGLFVIFALLINQIFFQFQGNNYLPNGTMQAGICLLLMCLGFHRFLNKNHYFCQLSRNLLGLFGMMVLLTLLANAVQYTPFAPIDQQLLALDEFLHIHLLDLMTWTNKHQLFQIVLGIIYDSLVLQMSILPLLIAFFGKFQTLQTYCRLMLISALLGFGFYYFFPTTAPASLLDSSLFGQDQIATGLKFMQIHNHQMPSTQEGGMISLPSFHVIWAWYCLYLVKDWPWVFKSLLPINLLLGLSCVLLGWHYAVDIIGAGLIIFLTNHLERKLQVGP